MHTIWHWREDKYNEKLLTDVEELHIIQMTKAKYEYEKDCNNTLAQWILFILDPNNKEVKSIMSDNNEIKETTEKLENISEDENVRKRAEILERWELEEKWGRASLIDYGKKEGIKEEKSKIVKNLISIGMEFEDICKVTELTLEEVEKINDDNLNT